MIELIKWGGSRLNKLDDLNNLVEIINMYVKDNKKVICVLSAFKNYTDVLINKYCPFCTLAPTLAASSAYCSSFS